MTALNTRPAPRSSAAPAGRAPAPVVTVLLTAVAYFMVTLDSLVVVTALPSIHRDLGGTLDSLQWTISALSLTSRRVTVTL